MYNNVFDEMYVIHERRHGKRAHIDEQGMPRPDCACVHSLAWAFHVRP